MHVQEIHNQHEWDTFVVSHEPHSFLHAWEWGEFNRAVGDKVWRLGAYEDGTLRAVVLAIIVRARRGNFLFVPHGPIFQSQDLIERNKIQATLQTLTEELKTLAKQEEALFIRISPLLQDIRENREMFRTLGFRPAPTHIHAETTWTLDLAPPENELLAGMRKTTRNLIRRAEREGVEITMSDTIEDVNRFYDLYAQTSRKQNFTPFSRRYLQEEVRAFAPNGRVLVVLGWYASAPRAGAIIPLYGTSAYYHHGASSLAYPKIPTAYAVQWAAIQEAKKRGFTYYNFWGIAPNEDDVSHPWAGLTLFKKGFGGYRTDYVHTRDLPLSWKYWITWAIETMRRKKRNL